MSLGACVKPTLTRSKTGPLSHHAIFLPENSAASATENGGGDSGDSLAVVGISCRFPGGCDSPEAFWDFLRNGADATSGVPSDR